jgi:hypothetical protein
LLVSVRVKLDISSLLKEEIMAGSKSNARWIAGATANSHGQFKAKAQKAGMSTAQYAQKMQHAPGLTGKQARLASTLMGLKHK